MHQRRNAEAPRDRAGLRPTLLDVQLDNGGTSGVTGRYGNQFPANFRAVVIDNARRCSQNTLPCERDLAAAKTSRSQQGSWS